jgi:hypothetical protein
MCRFDNLRQISLWEKVCKTSSQPKVGCKCHTPVLPTTWGNTNRRIVFQAGSGIKRDSTSKTTQARRAGAVAQVVDRLPRFVFSPQNHKQNQTKPVRPSMSNEVGTPRSFSSLFCPSGLWKTGCVQGGQAKATREPS